MKDVSPGHAFATAATPSLEMSGQKLREGQVTWRQGVFVCHSQADEGCGLTTGLSDFDEQVVGEVGYVAIKE